MRRTVSELSRFYATPEGAVTRRMVAAKLNEAWPDLTGCDVLGLGYTTPWLDLFPAEARRVIAAMPAAQGAEIWPEGLKSRCVLVDEHYTPFPSAMFDRIFIMHGLEEAPNPEGVLMEASRLLTTNGRLILAVTARGGLWTHAEKTPFGHGQPFSRSQLEHLLRAAELEPLAWSHALFVPPMRSCLRWAQTFETWAPRIWPYPGGLILMEAGKRAIRSNIRGTATSVIDDLRDALGVPQPQPVHPVAGCDIK
ncbi:class I SAM-dependent methyltransferase [Asticcacaulis sp. YBE204]|uniref:class I SAM-dependent methyltransferase n=1 Tax=Asticcacaulis sp. YBE204 TaxID=1282363 RepID=UPI0003C3DF8A|nr:methyltransferase domain-containing protein [Asticcacaulis sp. YBE204]ESQ80148.1 methyltransferase type 11 [Asticcacaulis sp. YBE204]